MRRYPSLPMHIFQFMPRQTHTLSLFSGHRGIRPLRIELVRFQRGNMSRVWSRVMDLCVWTHTHRRFPYKNHICGRRQLGPQGPGLQSQQWPLRSPSITSVYLCGTEHEFKVDNRRRKMLHPKETCTALKKKKKSTHSTMKLDHVGRSGICEPS